MVVGSVTQREAIIAIEIAAPTGPWHVVEAAIDTGYNGQLTLSDEIVKLLGLRFAGHRRGLLADGNITNLEIYIARVKWHDVERDTLITQTNGSPLIGMELLDGSRLTIDVVDGGVVTIDELS